LIADIDPKAIEIAADEFVGPVGLVEYKQLVEKLGGTRRNWVFSFSRINPPRCEAEAAIAEAEEKKIAEGTAESCCEWCGCYERP
jgi:hypothetical protein